MNEYTQERVKKEAERKSLDYFLDAYESVTDESIEGAEDFERPDFICNRKGGEKIGIELGKIRRGHPNDILWDRLIKKQQFMSSEQCIELIQQALFVKEKKRREQDWTLPEGTILLLELTDIPLIELEGTLNHGTLPDIHETGFLEIWIADFTGLEAYNNVELFCLRPDEWWGYHRRVFQKPYG